MTRLVLARVFSGIQPTGIPHLGNYFGALLQWTQLATERKITQPRQDDSNDRVKYENGHSESETPPPPAFSGHNQAELASRTGNNHGKHNIETQTIECDKPIFSIVDVHAYTSSRVHFGASLYSNILDTAASLLAIGLTPQNCILFRQSDVLEHYYLDNVLQNFASTQRLFRMNQYKEKLANCKGTPGGSVPNGLLNYPILQAADILLYKAQLVPVGEDQTQHIELTRDIARKFNVTTESQLFPEPKSILSCSKHARRVKSLRDPTRKMSKSAGDLKSFIEIVDEPEVVVEKVKKAMTDCESRVYFDADKRPGISNLMRIHHLITGISFEQIERQYAGVQSANYKLELADVIIERFTPIRKEFKRIREDHAYLEATLKLGYDQAKPLAEETISQVKTLLGSIRPK